MLKITEGLEVTFNIKESACPSSMKTRVQSLAPTHSQVWWTQGSLAGQPSQIHNFRANGRLVSKEVNSTKGETPELVLWPNVCTRMHTHTRVHIYTHHQLNMDI